MSFNRRQFLFLGGAFGGAGLTILAHRLITSGSTTEPGANLSASTSAPTAGEMGVESAQVAQPAPSPLNQEARIVVISDLNSQYGSTEYEPEVDKAIALIPDWQPDLVLCGGDMVAGQNPSLSESQIRAMWDAFDQHVGAPLRQAQIPYGFTLGNHDASGAMAIDGSFLFDQERDLAAAHWNNPAHDPGLSFVDRAGFPFYYTFQQNDIFFLVWDASTAQIPRDQIAWVDRSLASSTAQAAKMRIVIGHLPLYAIAVGRDSAGEYLDNADDLRAMLERHRVHTYISGHHHAYYPGHVGQLDTLHCGILGSGMRPLLNGRLRPQKTITIIDAKLDSSETLYTTYDVKTMELVDQQSLPRLIAAPNGKVLRRDVKWEELTPEEQSMPYVPSE